MLTAVPGGTLLAATVTVTGFVVVAGRTTSGAEYEAVGAAGALMPPTATMASEGASGSVTLVGSATEGGTVLKLRAAPCETASMRTRPNPPAPPLVMPGAAPAAPPRTSIDPFVPDVLLAMSRTAPPLPPPPGAKAPPPEPPRARITPVR